MRTTSRVAVGQAKRLHALLDSRGLVWMSGRFTSDIDSRIYWGLGHYIADTIAHEKSNKDTSACSL